VEREGPGGGELPGCRPVYPQDLPRGLDAERIRQKRREGSQPSGSPEGRYQDNGSIRSGEIVLYAIMPALRENSAVTSFDF